MPISKLVLLAYGFILLAGAFMGLKAGSKISLIMGLISGSIVLGGLYIARNNPKLGIGIIAVTSAFLSISFLMRYLKTQKVMPSLVLLILSLIALAISIFTLLPKKQ